MYKIQGLCFFCFFLAETEIKYHIDSVEAAGRKMRRGQSHWHLEIHFFSHSQKKKRKIHNHVTEFINGLTATDSPPCPSLYPECSGPLGMEGGIISNQQITASSTHRALFGLQKWYPYFARLNRKGLVNAWTAAENDRWPWIQVQHLHSARARAGDEWTKRTCEYAKFVLVL